MPRKTLWYISEFDSHTNEVIAQLLPNENCHSQVLCQDGKKRDLWQTDYATITRLKKSKQSAHLVFTIFKRSGEYSPVIKYDFPKRTTAESRRVKAWIEEQKQKKEKQRQEKDAKAQDRIDEKIAHHKK